MTPTKLYTGQSSRHHGFVQQSRMAEEFNNKSKCKMCNDLCTKIYLRFHWHSVCTKGDNLWILNSSGLSEFFYEVHRNWRKKKKTLPAVKPWATRIRFPSAAPKSLIKRIELAIPLYLLRNSIKLHRRLNNITLQYLFCLELQYKYHPCLPMFSFLFILGSLSNDDGDA